MNDASDFPRRGLVQEHEIAIDATPEQVWDAITTPEGLTSWYVLDAKVVPGEGGTQWVSWGGDMAIETTHLVWKPGERLVLGHPDHANQTGWGAILQEYTIRTEAGRTVLRLVQSGMPDDGSWDSEYECTSIGWRGFFNALKHAVERQAGRQRTPILRFGAVPGDEDAVWARLAAADGLGVAGLGGAAAGGTLGVAPGGVPQSAQVVDVVPHRLLQLCLPDAGDALLTIDVTNGKDGAWINATLAAFDGAPADAAATQAWETALDALLAAG